MEPIGAWKALLVEDYYRTIDFDWFKHRLVVVSVCVFAVFVIIVARLFFLQVVRGEKYRRLSQNNCIRLQSIAPPRGLIFDRNGVCIADNRPSFDLCLIPKDAKNADQTILKVSSLTGIPREKLKRNFVKNRTSNPYAPVLIAGDVGRDVLALAESHNFDLPGVVIKVRPRRYYLFDGKAAHIVGYAGIISRAELQSPAYRGYEPESYVGKYGAEKLYEPFLQGKYGGRQVEVNASGKVVRVLKTVEAESGNHVYLTIDFGLQQRAEALFKGLSGAAVAIDPRSGEVLAMVSSPSFSQNAFVNGMSAGQWHDLVKDPRNPLENKAIQAEYPPGSVYKIVTAIAAMDEGVIDRDTAFFCPGYYKYGNRVFRCWRSGGHGSVSVVDALAQSCDVFFYQAGQKIGVERLAWYARGCGLGKPTGIALPSEDDGLVPTNRWKLERIGTKWQGGETLSVAIGQSYTLVTPIQMAVLTAAVANGGVLKCPVILKLIETPEGVILKRGKSVGTGVLPASPEALDIVREGMWKAVNDRKGTAWYSAHSRKMDISGKTGTAQVVASPRESDDDGSRKDVIRPHSWFVGYAPSDAPRIAVAVVVEHGGHGSSAAAPIARKIMEAYLENGG